MDQGWIRDGREMSGRRIGAGSGAEGAGANALRTVGSALVLVMYGEIKAMLSKQDRSLRLQQRVGLAWMVRWVRG